MSRSKRKTPIFGITTANSEKQDKRLANRAYRRKVKHCLHYDNEVLPLMREVSNVWGYGKDGKAYRKHRWDADALRKAMRK